MSSCEEDKLSIPRLHTDECVGTDNLEETLSSNKNENDSPHDGSCTKTSVEVFKKPVLFIGPRKGKSIGKMQVLKSVDSHKLAIEVNKSPHITRKDNFYENVSPMESVSDEDYVDESKMPEKQEERKVHKVSPAVKVNENCVPLPYKEPKWSGIPTKLYKFEVLKNGSILETIDLSCKPYFVFGRLTTCDIHMAHPTVSRYHAILQFRSNDAEGSVGFYIYDLGSTHGTFLNKYRIKPNMYVRVHVGHLLKLGGSSRMFILQGPEEDMEKETELSITELKEKHKEQKIAQELQELQERDEIHLQNEKEGSDGIDWGMGDDADEETDLSENPFASAPNEELYLDDPKKTLRGWFEREGYDLEYNVEEKGFGQFLCRVELPVESAKGGTILAESLVKGKKKEAVIQCALEACRILDRYGLLRQAKHESRKRKVKNWEENDYYDSDEDEFLDRTGTVERKREQRMKAAGKIETETETYDSLVQKHKEILHEIKEIQKQLNGLLEAKTNVPIIDEDEDALDAFMTNLSSEVPDHKLISKLKSQLLTLKKEEVHVTKLMNIACPAILPQLLDKKSSLSPAQRRNIIPLKQKISTQVKSRTEQTASVENNEKEDEDDEDSKLMKKGVAEEKNSYAETNQKKTENNTVYVDVASSDSFEEENIHVIPTDFEVDHGHVENIKQGAVSKPDGKVIGPSLPPEQFVSESQAEKRKKRIRHRQNKKMVKELDISNAQDPNYSMWVPPQGQSGDGRTKLNEKYGY